MAVHPHLAHRGGLHRSVQPLRPTRPLFERLGGRAGIARIVDHLYDAIHADEVLRPMFRRDPVLERANQQKFYEEWFGGEPAYSRHVASVGLQLRHRHARIAPSEARRWIGLFAAAMKACDVDTATHREVMTVLRPLAMAFVNDEEPVGPPDPDRHRCGRDPRREAAARAAGKGDVAGVASEIRCAPRLLGPSTWGRPSLLHVAASRGRVEVIRLLVEAGADPNEPCHVDYGQGLETPLCGALRRRKRAAAALLRELGARDDILTAATVGDIDMVRAFLDEDATVLDASDPADDLFGLTALHHAANAGQRDVALLLLSRGADVGHQSHSLLRAAADDDDVGLVRELLRRGAAADRIGAGRWVLHSELSPLLVEHGADVSYESDPWGSWLWQYCTGNHAQKDDPEVVRALLAHGADPNAVHPFWRRNALHFAAKAGFAGTVAALIDGGADVHVPDAKDRETALFHAFRAGSSVDVRPVVRLLLAAGADVEHRNRLGRTVRQASRRAAAILDELSSAR